MSSDVPAGFEAAAKSNTFESLVGPLYEKWGGNNMSAAFAPLHTTATAAASSMASNPSIVSPDAVIASVTVASPPASP